MRPITHIVIHCSATPKGRYHDAADIDHWHRARGWARIGYHFVIRLDGTLEVGRPLGEPGAHVAGHNQTTIGICYIGGMNADGTAAEDTRTDAQKAAMRTLVLALKSAFPMAEVCGHRDFPGVKKDCPSFDVREWWRSIQH